MNDSIRIAHILVPIDGSEFSRHAAEHAVRLAGEYAAEVIFLHVVDDQIVGQLAHWQPHDGEPQARERLIEQGETYLRDVARLAEAQGVAHREVIAEGDPCMVICETATRCEVNLIVMGKIGRRGARRILVGSITRRVIESTDLPILVVTLPPPSTDAALATQPKSEV